MSLPTLSYDANRTLPYRVIERGVVVVATGHDHLDSFHGLYFFCFGVCKGDALFADSDLSPLWAQFEDFCVQVVGYLAAAGYKQGLAFNSGAAIAFFVVVYKVFGYDHK